METVKPKKGNPIVQRGLLAALALATFVVGWAIIVQYRVQTAGLAQ